MPPQPKPSLKDLLAKAADDAKRLAHAQLALARSEISASGQRFGTGAGLGIATLGIAAFAVLFLLVTLALGIAAVGLPYWAGFLIVAVLLMIAGTVTALVAKKQLAKASGPSLTMIEFEKTKAALSGAVAPEEPPAPVAVPTPSPQQS
ncbi:MAG: phage holin family protein [Candidatus Nanopelagicales bacterium]